MDESTTQPARIFYTVKEAASIMRVDSATLYRAIREDAFPAVQIRTRYIVPAKALDELIERASTTGALVNPKQMIADCRRERDMQRLHPEWV